MINLDDIVPLNLTYFNSRNILQKAIFFFFGSVIFLEILRSQVSEINLIQLIPGFYFALLITFFFVLLFASESYLKITIEADNKRTIGTKTNERGTSLILTEISFSLAILTSFLIVNSILPLSFDCFNSYGEKTIENYWSFDEVINLEFILLSNLLFLSQVPLFIFISFNTEKKIMGEPDAWRLIAFGSLIVAGIVTPTIDGSTQLSFAGSTFLFYLFAITSAQKRLKTRFEGSRLFGST